MLAALTVNTVPYHLEHLLFGCDGFRPAASELSSGYINLPDALTGSTPCRETASVFAEEAL